MNLGNAVNHHSFLAGLSTTMNCKLCPQIYLQIGFTPNKKSTSFESFLYCVKESCHLLQGRQQKTFNLWRDKVHILYWWLCQMLGQKKLQKATRLPALERTWIPAPETKTPVQQSAFGNRLGSSLSEKEAFIENIVIGIDTSFLDRDDPRWLPNDAFLTEISVMKAAFGYPLKSSLSKKKVPWEHRDWYKLTRHCTATILDSLKRKWIITEP